MNSMKKPIPEASAATAVSGSTVSDLVLDPATVRKSAQLSLQEMADLIGMSLNGYSMWERGSRTPGGPALQLLRLIADDPSGIILALQAISKPQGSSHAAV
jgi:DNA-binding transcriptional regulator YiaG